MRGIYAPMLSLCLLAVSCASPILPATPASPSATPPPAIDPLETPWNDRSIFKAGLIPLAQASLKELNGASVYHIQFNIAENLFRVSGSEEVSYTNTEGAPLAEIFLRLFPNILGGVMKVTSLLVDGAVVSPNYGLRDSLMIVPLAAPLQPGQNTLLHMEFDVTIPQSVETNYGVLAYAEDVLTLAHAYPMIAVYDDEGWKAEIPPQEGDVTYADAAFYIVRITAPAGLTLVTSGHRVSLTEAGQTQTLTVASGPARDFYLAASPKYKETTLTSGTVTIRNYAPDSSKDGAQQVLDVASRAIAVYSGRYAPFPYTELDIVSTPTLALGIEYPGMIAITSWIYDTSDPSPVNYLEATIAHEVGHQWFYNLVGDNQLDDPWLDEALTQFATLQYYADVYGPEGEEGFANTLQSRWAQSGKAAIPIGLPVAEYQGGEYGSIIYGRGPLFFVALREKMGTAAFDAFLKEYTKSLSWKIATPGILQSLAEKNCACELDDIFAEWVY